MTMLLTTVFLAGLAGGVAAPAIINVQTTGSAASSVQPEADEIRRRVKPGQKIVIVDEQGRELTGRVEEIKPDALALLVGRGRTDVPYRLIMRIDRPHDGVSDGALIGLGIGAGLGLSVALAAAGNKSGFVSFEFSEVAPIAVPVLGGIGAVVGLALDAAIRRDPHLYRRPSGSHVGLSPIVGRSARGIVILVSW